MIIIPDKLRRPAEIEREELRKQLAEARVEIEKATTTEAERWAERLNWLHTKHGADCSGTDSADLLDCVEDEIKQVINKQSELIEQMRSVSEHRRAIMLEIADSLENNKLTDEEEYEDQLIDSLRTNAEEKAALRAADTALQNSLADQIERKDKLIEQMREALRTAKNGLASAEYIGVDEDIEKIEAALSAAERGDK